MATELVPIEEMKEGEKVTCPVQGCQVTLTVVEESRDGEDVAFVAICTCQRRPHSGKAVAERLPPSNAKAPVAPSAKSQFIDKSVAKREGE